MQFCQEAVDGHFVLPACVALKISVRLFFHLQERGQLEGGPDPVSQSQEATLSQSGFVCQLKV